MRLITLPLTVSSLSAIQPLIGSATFSYLPSCNLLLVVATYIEKNFDYHV